MSITKKLYYGFLYDFISVFFMINGHDIFHIDLL